jgi:hypothetical protein
MENRTNRPRVLIILLSVLLLTGAIAAAFSINGGAANPVFAQPPGNKLEQNVVAPVTGSSSELETFDKQSSQPGYGCNHADSAMNPADW